MAMAQQVPIGSSDILFDSEPAAAAGDYCNVQVRSEARKLHYSTAWSARDQTVSSRADDAATATVCHVTMRPVTISLTALIYTPSAAMIGGKRQRLLLRFIPTHGDISPCESS